MLLFQAVLGLKSVVSTTVSPPPLLFLLTFYTVEVVQTGSLVCSIAQHAPGLELVCMCSRLEVPYPGLD